MNELLIAARSIHFAASVLLFGEFAFLLSVAAPAFREAPPSTQDEQATLHRRLVQIAACSLVVFVLSDIGWLAAQAAIMSGTGLVAALNPDTLATVLVHTLYGNVWQIRFVLVIAFVVLVALFRDKAPQKHWRVVGPWAALLTGSLLASIAWSGHAVGERGADKYIHVMADAAHLLAAGGWLGALLPLALLLSRVDASHESLQVKAIAVQRFSRLGLVCVSTLVLTGLINAWYLVGGLPALLETRYGQLLILKLAFFLVMLTLAAINRLHWSPRIIVEHDAAHGYPALNALLRNALIEFTIGLAILMIVGMLGVTIPAKHAQPAWPFESTPMPEHHMQHPQ